MSEMAKGTADLAVPAPGPSLSVGGGGGQANMCKYEDLRLMVVIGGKATVVEKLQGTWF